MIVRAAAAVPEAETDRRIETTLHAQIRRGLVEETAELDEPVPARRAGSAARTSAQRGVADAWVL
jgi:hypothetical protein